MEILVVGNELNEQECRLKFGSGHYYRFAIDHTEIKKQLNVDVVFDFPADSNQIHVYQNFEGIVFMNVSKNSMQEILSDARQQASFFGFMGLPTFLNREILETSLFREKDREKLNLVCSKLNTRFAVVKDQVGLITARVISMIINEAYFAVQEGIASRIDIDLAMKLGTNYPFGPFEWSEKIGIRNVYDLLSAVYRESEDERYKVCDLLKEEVGSRKDAKMQA